MADIGINFEPALFQQRLGCVHQRAAGIDDVVDEDTDAPVDVADHVHHFRLAGALAALVDDGERRVDPLREGAGAHDAADVGRYHHDLRQIEALADVAHHHRRGVEIVGGNVEEALNLAGVEIDGEHAVGARIGDQIGDELRGDRRARPRLAILPRVAEVRHHRGDAPRRRAPERVDYDQ